MTEIEAVEMSLNMWLWLHENPIKEKSDYPLYFTLNINKMRCNCPCCVYYNKCDYCPLGGNECAKGNFSKWFYTCLIESRKNVKLSKKSSKIICNMLEERFKKLLEEKNN